ncbi:hypothetical protein BH20ACT18_BH20ACT18_12340 [soil metagenome]
MPKGGCLTSAQGRRPFPAPESPPRPRGQRGTAGRERREAARGCISIRLLFDLEPRQRDAEHELAFRLVREVKRAWVLVQRDAFDSAAPG